MFESPRFPSILQTHHHIPQSSSFTIHLIFYSNNFQSTLPFNMFAKTLLVVTAMAATSLATNLVSMKIR